MMRNIVSFFVLAGLTALMSTSCYKSDIENLQKQIDELKGGSIATIETQIANINSSISDLQRVESALGGYVKSLQSDNTLIKGQIDELTATHKSLSSKIDGLKDYVDGELSSYKDWAEASFATLAQYDSLATVVAGIPSKIDAVSKSLGEAKTEITANYEKAIKDAVSASEESMKKWVNEQLADYYTIAQIDAILDSICSAQMAVDSTIIDMVAEQKAALDTTKNQITDTYKAAIKESIDSLEGKINEKIATDIATAKGELQEQIDSINDEITIIKDRLTDAEETIAALLARIQSIVVIPQYSDGSVMVTGDDDLIRFDIAPASAAQSLVTAWNNAGATAKAGLMSFRIDEVLTKGNPVPSATVKSAAFVDGELHIRFSFANLPEHAVGSLHIAYGKSDLSSNCFPLYNVPSTNLSSTKTANCYIISAAGKYKFKTVKGNSTTSVGNVSSVSVLWESYGTSTPPNAGDLIKTNVSYADNYITFSTGDQFPAKKGNAVIAAKDGSGNILWSWHIWLTDTPGNQDYNNAAGTMMDRNLGATSSSKGQTGALGLMYQWGRKDPFLGADGIESTTKAASTLTTWPTSVAAQDNSSENDKNLKYSIANPTTFISIDSSPKDWYCTNETYKNDNLWKNVSGSPKTIYDPCPAGYRVPDGGVGGVWATAFNTTADWTTATNWDSTNKGMDFGKTDLKLLGTGANTCWYPAAGYLNIRQGSPTYVGSEGYCWSCTPTGKVAYTLQLDNTGKVKISSGDGRAGGRSVRCIKE